MLSQSPQPYQSKKDKDHHHHRSDVASVGVDRRALHAIDIFVQSKSHSDDVDGGGSSRISNEKENKSFSTKVPSKIESTKAPSNKTSKSTKSAKSSKASTPSKGRPSPAPTNHLPLTGKSYRGDDVDEFYENYYRTLSPTFSPTYSTMPSMMSDKVDEKALVHSGESHTNTNATNTANTQTTTNNDVSSVTLVGNISNETDETADVEVNESLLQSSESLSSPRTATTMASIHMPLILILTVTWLL
jgi:hypothetical protein